MFASAELGQSMSAARYEAALPGLRDGLLQSHLALRDRNFPVIVVVAGADGAGKGELVHRLNEWLDPRGVETQAFSAPSDEERERPPYWRFWRALPARGRIGILFGSWYSQPIIARAMGKSGRREFEAAIERIADFEEMLAADGALILKLWLHLSKREQKRRLKKLRAAGRLGPDDWKHFKRFDHFADVSERALRRTDTGTAPWHVIDATDRRFREFSAGNILLGALRARLAQPAAGAKPARPTPPAAPRVKAKHSILDHVDLSARLAAPAYERQLEQLQTTLGQLAWAAHEQARSMVLVFEGWDAAGKGSSIRRVTQALDPRLYQVVGVAAPTDEERAHHYLWRFWRHLPRGGVTTIFDRSWYGRVLVERVEGFAPPEDWGRAFHEINAFEEELVEHGIVLAKFWLHLSPGEQLRRFKERERVPYKRFKITAEDWRNRERWDAYRSAVDEMVARCSPAAAPWTLVAADDKRSARIQILKTIVRGLRAAL